MQIANVAGRLAVLSGDGFIDVAKQSDGAFGPDPQSIYERWDEFAAWATEQDWSAVSGYRPEDLGAPVPTPRQVFAIGLNYGKHAAEAGLAAPTDIPPTFTKFPTCLTGPNAEVRLPSANVDWEVELVVVVGRGGRDIPADQAWEHVAGLTVGQDLSERVVQKSGPAPQFSLGKSFPGFGPTGPAVVTLDEIDDRDDLALSCSVNGVVMQDGRTSDLIFSVPELIARLSAVCELLPGDLIFTGTPDGVGNARNPKILLNPGDILDSEITGVGRMRTTFTS